jgi:hypothetical protein
MARTTFVWALLGLLAMTTGCAMCANPYDDCYPTYGGGCEGGACTGPRAGSVRAVGDVVVPANQGQPTPVEGYYEQPDGARVMTPAKGVQAAPPQQQAKRSRQASLPWDRQQVAASAVQRQSYRQQQTAAVPQQQQVATPRVARAVRANGVTSQAHAQAWQMIPPEDQKTAQIVSVTDRKADETAVASEGSQQVADAPAAPAGQAYPWNARRTSTVTR